jgi:NAD+ synthase
MIKEPDSKINLKKEKLIRQLKISAGINFLAYTKKTATISTLVFKPPNNMNRAEQREAEKLYTQLKFGLETYFKENGFKKAVLGLSGGIDSSLTLKIAVDALGAENVTAILMPENGVSKQENIAQSKMLCDFFKVNYHMQAINQLLLSFSTLPWKQNKIAYINTKARLRGLILYNYANTHDALVLGTSNKSEVMVGYGTKYGDLAVDLFVLADLYKTEIYKIGKFIGLPDEILKKKPSAELYDGQTDEAELGGTYKDIDNILQQMDLGEAELIGKGINSALVRNVFKLHKKNRHKSMLPYVIPIARDEKTTLPEVTENNAEAAEDKTEAPTKAAHEIATEKTESEETADTTREKAKDKPQTADTTQTKTKGIEPIPNEIPTSATIPNQTIEEAAAENTQEESHEESSEENITQEVPAEKNSPEETASQENAAQEVTLDEPQPNPLLDEKTTNQESK